MAKHPKPQIPGQGFLFDHMLETLAPSVGVYERAVKLLRTFSLVSDARQKKGFGKIFEDKKPENFHDFERHYGDDLYNRVLPGARMNEKKHMARARQSFREAGGYIALRKTVGYRVSNKRFKEDWDNFLTKYYIVPDVTKLPDAPKKPEDIESRTKQEAKIVKKARDDFRKLLEKNRTLIEEGRTSRAA